MTWNQFVTKTFSKVVEKAPEEVLRAVVAETIGSDAEQVKLLQSLNDNVDLLLHRAVQRRIDLPQADRESTAD
jgi:hypothetical protein